VLAYDAARKSVAAALLKTGHRVRRRPDSHQALAQYAKSLADLTNEQALERFDRLRRNRNRPEYGSKTFGQAEVRGAIDTAKAVQTACSKLT
jgi:HEPN domain